MKSALEMTDAEYREAVRRRAWEKPPVIPPNRMAEIRRRHPDLAVAEASKLREDHLAAVRAVADAKVALDATRAAAGQAVSPATRERAAEALARAEADFDAAEAAAARAAARAAQAANDVENSGGHR